MAGSRLQPRFIAPEGGERSFRTLYDQKVQAECMYLTASDGEQRCLPRLGVNIGFKDDQCTQPIAIAYNTGDCSSDTAEPDYAYEFGDCDTNTVYRVREKWEPAPDQVVYAKYGDTCTEAWVSPGYDLLFSVEVTKPTDWVRGTSETSGEGRLVAKYIRGDDGSRIRVGTEDTEFGFPCEPQRDSHGEYRCVPVSPLSEHYGYSRYSSSDCGSPTVGQNRCLPTEAPPKYATATISTGALSGCNVTEAYLFERGDLVETQYAWDFSGDEPQCTEAPLPPELGDPELYTLGKELEPSRFAPISVTRASEPRLVRSRYTGDGLAALEDLGFWHLRADWFDNELQAPCTFKTAADGKQRCLPVGGDAFLYADAECETPVGMPGENCETGGPFFSQAWANVEACPPTTGVYSLVGEPISVTVVYMKSPDGCFYAMASSDPFYVYAMGEEVPADMFVEYREVQD